MSQFPAAHSDVAHRPRGDKVLLGWAIGLTCAAYLLTLAISQSPHTVIDRYDVLANSILAGEGLSFGNGPTLARGPLYPLWLGVELLILGGRLSAVRNLELLLVLAITVVVFRATRRIGTPVEAFAAALIAGAYPPFLFYTAKLGSETFSALLMSLATCVALEGGRSRQWRDDAAFGFVAGLLVLTKSVFVVCLFVRAISISFTTNGRRFMGRLLITALCCSAIVAPWWIRNVAVVGEAAPLQTLVWWNFWYDFDLDDAWKSGGLGDGGANPIVFAQFGANYLGHPYGLTATADIAQERFLRAQAFHWIHNHPGSFIRKVASNCVHFWTLVSSTRASSFLSLQTVAWCVLLVFGTRETIRRGARTAAVWSSLLPVGLMLTMSPVLAVFRHSLVLVPVMAPLTAIGTVSLLTRLGISVDAVWRGPRSD